MANAMWPKPMGCFRLITSLSGSVPIMGVHMSHIYLFPKRFRNLALASTPSATPTFGTCYCPLWVSPPSKFPSQKSLPPNFSSFQEGSNTRLCGAPGGEIYRQPAEPEERLFWLLLRNPRRDLGSRSLLLDGCAAKLLPSLPFDLEATRWACAILSPPKWSRRSIPFSNSSHRCLRCARTKVRDKSVCACAAEALGLKPASPVGERVVPQLPRRSQNRAPGGPPRVDSSCGHRICTRSGRRSVKIRRGQVGVPHTNLRTESFKMTRRPPQGKSATVLT
ncbi:hypothetical protein Krac_1645 [Ktedonobacter racemifer DSM 44963]|uniref:Uncharacterized protein n=1 Tax=Ktedonobacter racemifer DSM 44963 TaxID=485913 RepID=D6U2M8_KTERA|nr:hypothetical protein Krac_1645 [Ktedonobacter racemifer DSM 44963]